MALYLLQGFMAYRAADQQAEAQQDMYNYQAAVAERNAVIANQDRIQAIRTAEIAAADKARENRRKLAATRAAFGNTGLEMSGSPLEVLADSSVELAIDQRRVQYEGKVRGREGALRVLGLKDDANIARASASNAKAAGQIAKASVIVNTGVKIAEVAASGVTSGAGSSVSGGLG